MLGHGAPKQGQRIEIEQIAGGNHRRTRAHSESFQHIGILSLEFHVDKLSRPLL